LLCFLFSKLKKNMKININFSFFSLSRDIRFFFAVKHMSGMHSKTVLILCKFFRFLFFLCLYTGVMCVFWTRNIFKHSSKNNNHGTNSLTHIYILSVIAPSHRTSIEKHREGRGCERERESWGENSKGEK